MVINRFKATRSRAKAEAEHSGVGTIFVQLQEQLGRLKTRALLRHDKAFKVALVGESADDHGGPYREVMVEVVNELQSDALPLFIRCPNGVNGVGEHRDAFVPNPSAASNVHMDWFYFLGQLLGLALRQKETQLGLTLPSAVWKQLVAEPVCALIRTCIRSTRRCVHPLPSGHHKPIASPPAQLCALIMRCCPRPALQSLCRWTHRTLKPSTR